MFLVKDKNSPVASTVSLPPGVPGEVRGHLHVTFPSGLLWDCSTAPPLPASRVSVHCRWWGETTPGTIFRIPIVFDRKTAGPLSVTPTSVQYPVCVSWRKLKAYLEDMSHLTLRVGLGRNPDDMFVIGECLVPHLSSLTLQKPFIRTCSVLTSSGIHLGRLTIYLKLTNISSNRCHSTITMTKPPAGTVTNTLPRKRPISSTGSVPIVPKGLPIAPLSRVELFPTNVKWRKVETNVPRTEQTKKSQSDRLLTLGERGKEMIRNLLEQAKSLHSDMIQEVHRGGVVSPPAKETPDKDLKLTHDSESLEWVELTPPHSPESTSSVDVLEEVGLVKLYKEEEMAKLTPNEEYIPLHQYHPTEPLLNKQSHDQTLKSHDQILQQSCDRSSPTKEQAAIIPPISLLHILFELVEGTSLVIPSSPDVLPNVYIVCKLYCMRIPLCTGIYWSSRSPQFNIKQVIPIAQEDIADLHSQYLIIEVWHYQRMESAPSDRDKEDELLGLVKINLSVIANGLISAVGDQSNLDAVFPMTVVDSYCAVIDPFTGDVSGYLKLMVIAGTPQQLPASLGVWNRRPVVSQPCVTVYGSNGEEHSRSDPKRTRSKKKRRNKVENKSETKENERKDTEPTVTMETELSSALAEQSNVGGGPQQLLISEPAAAENIELELLISQAHHLPLLSSKDTRQEFLPRSYVTCHPHPSVSKLTTPTSIEATTNPNWDHTCVTSVPVFLVESGPCELEFQVWSLPALTNDDTDRLMTEADPHSHVFLGRAFVDLVPLLYGLRSLCGWYNITDLTGDIKGQLKVAVTPRKRLSVKTGRAAPCHCNDSTSLVQLSLHWSSAVSSIVRPLSDLSQCEKKQERSNDRTNLSLLRNQLKSHVEELDKIQESLLSRLQELQTLPTVDTGSMHTSTNTSISSCTKSNDSSTVENKDLKESEVAQTQSHFVSSSSLSPLTAISPLNNTRAISPPLCYRTTPSPLKAKTPSPLKTTNGSTCTAVNVAIDSSPVMSLQSPFKMSHPSPPAPLTRAAPQTPSMDTCSSPPSEMAAHQSHTCTSIKCPKIIPNSQSPAKMASPCSLSVSPVDSPLKTAHTSSGTLSPRSPPMSIHISSQRSPLSHLRSPLKTSHLHCSPGAPQRLSETLPKAQRSSETPPKVQRSSETPPKAQRSSETLSPHLDTSPKSAAHSQHSPSPSSSPKAPPHSLLPQDEHIQEGSRSPVIHCNSDGTSLLMTAPLSGEEESIATKERSLLNEEASKDDTIASDEDQEQAGLVKDCGESSTLEEVTLISLSDSSFDDKEDEPAATCERDINKELNQTMSDDIEEENEVQRILQRLLKRPPLESHSDTEQQQQDSTADTTQSSTTLSLEESSPVKLPVLSSEESDDDCYQARNRRIDRDRLPRYYQPEKELTNKLRSLRLLALSGVTPPPPVMDIATQDKKEETTATKRTQHYYPPISTPERNRLQRVFYQQQHH